MLELRKYGVASHVYMTIVKRGVVDHAVGADWTPVAGDVKISIDGGAAANVTNLPVAIAMGNSAIWDFSLAIAEHTGKKIVVTIADSATKAIEDNGFKILTFGHANAEIVQDLSASVAQTGDSFNIVNDAGFGNAKLVRSTTPANTLDVDAAHKTKSTVATGDFADILAVRAAKIDQLDAAVSSRSSHTAADIWAVGVRTLTAFGFAVDISNAAVSLIWDKAVAGIVTAGSIGKRIVDNLNATMTSRAVAGDAMALTPAERTAVANEVEAQIIDDTDSEKVLQAIVDKIASVNPDLGGLSVGAIATAVRDKAVAGSAAGSIGKVLSDLSARLPGAGTLAVATDITGAETAVLNAIAALNNISTVQAQAAAAAALVAYATAKTADIPSAATIAVAAAAQVTADHGPGSYIRNTEPPTAADTADTLLDRDMSAGADTGTETKRTVRQALRASRNRVDIAGGVVYKEDDATASHHFAVTTDPDAEPVVEINPTGGA